MQRLRYKCSHGELRQKHYPDIGDQLDAIMKLAQSLESLGIPLPAETTAWIRQCEAVKEKFKKGS